MREPYVPLRAEGSESVPAPELHIRAEQQKMLPDAQIVDSIIVNPRGISMLGFRFCVIRFLMPSLYKATDIAYSSKDV